MTLNPCELELDLYCHGLRLAPAVDLDGARPIHRSGAGSTTGLEIAIPAAPLPKREIYVHVPVLEPFARISPYWLARDRDGAYGIVDDRDGSRYQVRLPTAPSWRSRLTSRDVPMERVGTLRGMRLHICVTALTNIDDVVETCWAAKDESAVTFVELDSRLGGSRSLGVIAPYVAAIKRNVGMLVGLQLGAEHERGDRLIALGVDHLSFGAAPADLEAIAHCAGAMSPGAVSGEVVAGAATVSAVLDTIDQIAAAGAFPTVRVASQAEGADLRRVMLHLYDACRRHWLPIGAAPNGESSMVIDPDDAALLAHRDAGFYCYEGFRLWSKWAGAPALWKRMRAA